MKLCVDYQSEGAIKHMSSQGMLEQLVNSIIGDLSTTNGELYAADIIFDRSDKYVLQFCIKYEENRKSKNLNMGVLHLLVNCITEGSPL